MSSQTGFAFTFITVVPGSPRVNVVPTYNMAGDLSRITITFKEVVSYMHDCACIKNLSHHYTPHARIKLYMHFMHAWLSCIVICWPSPSNGLHRQIAGCMGDHRVG